jgi:rubrerythrin
MKGEGDKKRKERRHQMAFNPFEEKGIKMEKQIKSWDKIDVKPYDKEQVDPYTRCRVILMNGIEVEAVIFKHQFARMTADMELKKNLALSRRVEQEQQKMVCWLVPGNESTIENTIGYEQLAVDLTAYLAQNLSDRYVKDVFDFGLLEDFDHLYRYANLLDLVEGKSADSIVQGQTEIMPGRPTRAEHRHPFDDVRNFVDMNKSDPKDLLFILTLTSAEQQTMNFYMNVGNRATDRVGRGLYQEIGMIEEQHVTQYESLADPRASWFDMMVMHEYNECYLYYSMMEQETDGRIKKIWEQCLGMELEHLKKASEIMQKYEKKDAREVCGTNFPDPIILQSNIEYVRKVLASQVDLTANETKFVQVDELPREHRYFQYQAMINEKFVPDRAVIEEHIRKMGEDYRAEKKPHPVQAFRDRRAA